MKPQLVVIDNLEGAKELQDYLLDKEFVAVDTETTGLTARHEVIGFSVCAEDDKAFYLITHKWDARLEILLPVLSKDAVRPILEALKTKYLIMHNGIFDCKMIHSNFGIQLIHSLHTDTMELAHVLNENRRVGLKELATEYFGEDSTIEQKEMEASVLANGGQLTRANYELYKGDAHLIGKYGAKDTLLTLKLFYQLVLELEEQGLTKFFYEDESMPLLRGPTYELNTVGLQVDHQKLIQLKKTLQAECIEAKDFIYSEIQEHVKEKYPGKTKTTIFNIGANQQLSWLLFGKMKLEFNTLTKGGKAACKALGLRLPYTQTAKRDFIAICENRKDEVYEAEAIVNGKKKKPKKFKDPWTYIAVDKTALKKLAPRHKWIEKLLEYQKKTKLLSTYVEGLEERVQYGVIHPSFLQHGTTSGRYSSRSPNFQNLPRDDKRIKECIVARPGKVFVGADYSQLEPRVFAFTSGDPKLLAAFKTGNDFYSVTGIEVYDKLDAVPLKDGHPKAFGVLYPKLRQDSKVFTLASTYGATGFQLAPLMGKSAEDAQRDIDNYFEKFPDVAKMMLDSHKQAKEKGFVTNYFGRPRRIPEAMRINKLYGNVSHGELPYDARKLLNLAVNHRIQSTAASIVNRAAIKFYEYYKEADAYCKIVLQVHDSLVIECDESEAENVSIMLQSAMEDTVVLEGIALEAVPKIGKNLSEV